MSKIDYHSIRFYPSIIEDYFSGKLHQDKIIDWKYSLDEIILKTTKRNFSNRELLYRVLKKQHSSLQLSTIQKSNLDLLQKENTFTVTTGHQLSIYGGPAFFYSKMIDAIELAKSLQEKDPTNKYVPVFWMASEDHDFEEIQSVNLFNNKITWENSSSGAVGRFSTSTIQNAQKEWEEVLGENEQVQELKKLFKSAYLSNKTLAEATRYFVHELFKDSGLLIIDGDDQELKTLLKNTAVQELQLQTSKKTIDQQIERLKNYKIQAHPREINLFYLAENERERLVSTKDGISTANGKYNWSVDEFIELIQDKPEIISPNVFLRPLYQELCLPNVAYVGGAGEISYWLELPLVFQEFNIPFPVPVVRNSYVYLTEKQVESLKSLGLSLEDFFLEEEKIINKFIEKNADESLFLENEKQELTQFFNQIQEKAIKIDKNLEKVVQGELKRSISSLENMERRFINAEKGKKEQDKSKIKNLKAKIFPNGTFQERYNSIFDFSLKSNRDVFELIREQNKALDNSIKVIVY